MQYKNVKGDAITYLRTNDKHDIAIELSFAQIITVCYSVIDVFSRFKFTLGMSQECL